MASFNNRICIHPTSHLTELEQPKDGAVALFHPSICGDCDCPIVGKTFHCAACNSDLHPFCKNRPSDFTCNLHPHPLTLLAGGLVSRRCTVCDEEIRRVYYTCSDCEFDVHPVCSQLPRSIPSGPERPHPLRLLLGDNDTLECTVCSRQCGRWAYRCDVSSDTLHYSCLSKKIVLGPGGDRSRCLVQAPWGSYSYPPYHHGGYGGYPYNYPGGGFSGQAYGAGIVPNYNYYNNSYGGGFQGHHVPNYYYNHNNFGGGGGGFQNPSGGGGSGWSSGGGSGSGLGGWIGRIGGSLAVGVLCNLIANPISQLFL